MLVIVFAVYALVAIAFAARAVSGAPQPRRTDELIDGYDRALLAFVAVVSSAAWPLLLPFYAAGWLGSADARRVYHAAGARWDRVRGWTRRLYGLRGTAH
jgi:hypothetical protein